MALRTGQNGVLIDEIVPGAQVDYGFDYTLEEGESIVESTWEVNSGDAVVLESGITGKTVWCFVRCNKHGTVFALTNYLTTSITPRRLAKSIMLTCRYA